MVWARPAAGAGRQQAQVVGGAAHDGEGLLDGLGDDADLAEDGHEVRIARPAGHHVDVQVSGQARAGASPDVEPDVVPVGLEGPVHDRLEVADSLHHFHQRGRLQLAELPHVVQRGDHGMPAGIGEAVEHHEAAFQPGQDQVVRVLADWRLAVAAEETTLLLASQRIDVLHPPGGPEVGVALGASVVGVHGGAISWG